MKRFRDMLVVPIGGRGDRTPTALHEAVALAETSGASVTLLGHLDPIPSLETSIGLGEAHEPVEAVLRAALTERLGRWVGDVDSPVDVAVDVAVGRLPTEIVLRVADRGHDLVLVATDGSAAAAAAVRQIMATCQCPVWVLRPDFRGARVLAAVDPEHGDELNSLVLALARSQAELHDGVWHVMHAWDPPGFELLEEVDASVLDRDARNAWVAAVETAHRDAFDATLRAAGVEPGGNTRLVDGPVAAAIESQVALHRIDLLVMGSPSRGGGISVLGRTIEQVLHGSDCSVLMANLPR